MPATVVSFIGSNLVALGSVLGAGSAGALTAMAVGAAAVVAGAVAAQKLISELYSVPNLDSDRSRQATVRGTVEPQKLIYGEALVSGPISFVGVAGTDNRDLYHAIVLAGHPSDSISDIYFDDERIQSAHINASGNVTTGTFGPKDGTTICVIRKLTGSQTTADSVLDSAFSTINSSEHIGTNLTYIVTKFTLTDKSQETWDKFMPNDIKALVKGKKVYDPRQDSTSTYYDANVGVGTQRSNDSTTWEWSENPVWCLVDYLTDDRFGMDIDLDRIDLSKAVDAADICDATVSVPGGSEKRYTCNGVVFGTSTHKANINKLLSSMNGMLTYTNGKYVIRAGAFEAVGTGMTLTEDHMTGPVRLKTSFERNERFNTITGTFIDPTKNYKEIEFPKVQITSALTRDNNEELTRELKLSMTNSRFMAQRIAHKLIQLSDLQKVLTFPTNLAGVNISVGDRVSVTLSEFGYTNKTFVCLGWTLSESGSGGVNLTLREDDSSSYADLAQSGYSTVTPAGGIQQGFFGVPDPSGLSATAHVESIELDWTNPANMTGIIAIEVFASPNSSWSSAVKIGETIGTQFIHDESNGVDSIVEGDQRYYWVRARRFPSGEGSDAVSDRNPDSDTSTVQATKGALGDLASQDTVGDGQIDDNAVGTDQIEDGAVDTDQIADDAVTVDKIANTLESTNYVANTSGWRLTTAGDFEAGDGTFRGAVTATSGSIGGTTIASNKIYQGTGTWANSNTGFYLDNTGQFSLKDSLFFNPTNSRLTVSGNITADTITVEDTLEVFGPLQAKSLAAGSITREMLSQDVLDEIFGALATSVGGSNGDYKEGTGNFTTSGGTVTLGTSSDKFDHGTADVDVEFIVDHFFYSTTNYTTAQAQATLNFEVSADGTFTDLTSATKTHTLQFNEYDLSSYYGYTYLVYYLTGDVTKTFTSGSGNDIPDDTDLQFRVRVTGVGTAFTSQTVPFTLEANEGVTGVVSTGGNADTLDNLDSTAFLRSNTNDTFDGDLTVTGQLILQGSIDQYNVTDLDVTDKTITVNSGNTQSLSDGAGLIVDRGTAADASITWDETSDKFDFTHPITSTGADFTSTTTMDINLVANPPELNFEDTSSTSGTKRARWTLDSNTFSAQGLNDADSAVTQQLLNFNLSNGRATFGGEISSGAITSSGDIDAAGDIYTGSANSRFKENQLRFNASGSSYIDQATTGQTLYFRTSNNSSLDTTWLEANSAGQATFGGNVIVDGTLSSGAITSSASVIASGNSNSFGNTTISNLSVTSVTASGSITASGNSNSFGNTTVGTLTSGAITASGTITASNGTVIVGTSSTNSTVRTYWSDGSYLDVNGYGLEFARNASYIRPNNDNARTMYFGYTSLRWNQVQFHTPALKMGSTTFLDDSRNLLNIASLDLPTSGSKITLNAYSTSQEGGGIFFRDGFDASTNMYNLSIIARSRSNDGSADGLSINGYEGVAFSTGSNSYNERLYLHTTAAFAVPISTTSGSVNISADGTYGSNYGVLGFGGTSNGYNRVFGRNGTGDGLYLAAATGRKVFVRSNGAGSDHLALGRDDSYSTYGAIGFGNQLQNGYNRIFGRTDQSDGLYIASATNRDIYFRTNGGGANTFRMTAGGNFQLADVTVIDSSRNLTNILGLYGNGGTLNHYNTNHYFKSTTSNLQAHISDTGIGIGTSPSYKLHVTTNQTNVAVFDSSHDSGTYIWIRNSDAVTGRQANLGFAPANNIEGARISAVATEDFTTSANRTADLAFWTRLDGTMNERFRIKSNGQVMMADGGNFYAWTTSTTSGGSIHLPRAGYLTFYGDGGNRHSISSRNAQGTATDSLRINSYAGLYINLDSNNNNTSGADFTIGRHGDGAGTIADNWFHLDGENGAVGLSTTDPKGYLQTGSYMPFNSSGQYLTINHSSGAYLNLQSTASSNGEQIGAVMWTDTNGAADAHRQVAMIDAVVQDSTTDATDGANMRFFTKVAGSASSTPDMTLMHNGDFGVGISTPLVKFHVQEATTEQSRFAYNANNYTAVNYNGLNTVGGNMLFHISGTEKLRLTSDALQLRSGNSGKLVYADITGNEGRLTLSNGSNWGLIMRGITNAPRIGAWTGGTIAFWAAADSALNSVDTTKGESGEMFTIDNGNDKIISRTDLHVEYGKLIIKSSSNGFARIEGTDANHMIIMRGDRDSTTTGSDVTSYYQYGGTRAQGLGHQFYTGGTLANQVIRLGIHNDAIAIHQPLYYGSTEVLDSSRRLVNLKIAAGSTGARFEINDWHEDENGQRRFYFASNSHTYIRTGGDFQFRNSGDSGTARLAANGSWNLRASGDQGPPSDAAIAVTGTTVIDSNRNATFQSLDINAAGTIELKDQNGAVRGTLKADSGAPHFRISTSNNEQIGIYDGTTENIRINGSGDLNLKTGSLEINGTTVINSSRSLTNIASYSGGDLNVSSSSFVPLDIIGSNSTYTAIAVKNTGSGDAGIFFDASNGDLAGSDYAFVGQKNGLDFEVTTFGSAGNINLRAGDTNRLVVDKDGYTLFPSLDLAISNVNSSHGHNTYFRGTSTHFVLGMTSGNTFYCNYGNTGGQFRLYGNNFYYNDIIILDSSRNLKNIPTISIADGGNIKLYTSSQTSGGQIHLPRAGHISFYGDTSNHHAIMSRNNVGGESDDIRINSYADVWINLDSNNNNDTNANFYIGRHGGGIGSIDLLLSVDGNNGSLVTEGNVTAYGTVSDIRLKENIERIADPIDKVKQLDGITFDYKKDGSRSTGLIAQQLLEVLPEVVYETQDLNTGDEHYAVRYGNVVGLLVEAIKEQQDTIESLTKRIEELENGNHKD